MSKGIVFPQSAESRRPDSGGAFCTFILYVSLSNTLLLRELDFGNRLLIPYYIYCLCVDIELCIPPA